ncbi:MAG TPA: DUF3330 domain-containing protein [Blastocatellia bacterium]|nr:DUF3330 domain-containing protein [Blastocatellia bacterium]
MAKEMMSTTPMTEELVSCEICLKEIPVSEAISAEGADYFLYFCGTSVSPNGKSRKRPQRAKST